MANSKSVPKIRIGSLKAAISPNDTEGRIRYTITFSHLYKDGEQWKTTQTFDRKDLLILAKVADQAHTRIFKLQQGSGAHEEEQAPESGGPGRRFPSITGGPNRDAHTIKIRAINQKQHCATHRLEHPRMGRHFCWLYSGTRYHSVPCRPLCHPDPVIESTVQKNGCRSGATPKLRRCHGYWLRPLGRRIRQAILE